MSGKSHERAEAVVEAMVMNPDLKVVCVREIQKSLKFSAKALIEDKISAMGVSHLFDCQATETKRHGGKGIVIYNGLQDHTVDSIKSLEGFDVAWIEEAQSISKKSLKLLRPTIIRKKGAEIWATWNPNQPDDAIEVFMDAVKEDSNAKVIHVNYDENPFLNEDALKEIERDRERFPEDFDHVYLGGYDFRSDVRVFKNWRVEECKPNYTDTLYYGGDWGFAQDPTVLLRCWINEKKRELYVDYQIDGIGIEIDNLPEFFKQVPESNKYTIMADNSRPETISYMNRHGYNVKGAEKWAGSVEDGVEWLRGWTIVVHPRCKLIQKELRLYSYKVDKNDNILPKVDGKAGLDHTIDALRYALVGMIRNINEGFSTI